MQLITKRWQFFWPPVSDFKDIQLTVWVGCFAAFFYAGNWGLIMIFGAISGIATASTEALPKALEALIHFTIAGSIGWGIYKKYKAATIAGLVLAVIGFSGNLVTKGLVNKTSIIMLVNVWAFVQSTRGIFAFHGIISKTAQRSNQEDAPDQEPVR
jgi:hypothetical protein